MSAWYFSHLTLIQGMLISLPLAVSIQIALRSGVFSFASIGFYGIGAYATGILVMRGWSPLVAVPLIVLCSGFVGYFISAPLVRLRGLYLGMVTFAFDLILTVVVTNGGDLTGGALGLFGVPGDISMLGLVFVALCAIVLVSQLERRAVSRSLVAMRVSEELVQSVGIHLRHRKRTVFGISTALGAVSGSMYILTFTTVSPSTASFALVISALTMAVIGGVSSWVGAAMGTVIITWLPTLTSSIGTYRNLAYGVVLVLVVMFAPDGLLGILQSIRRWIVGRFERKPTGSIESQDAGDAASVTTNVEV